MMLVNMVIINMTNNIKQMIIITIMITSIIAIMLTRKQIRVEMRVIRIRMLIINNLGGNNPPTSSGCAVNTQLLL